MIPAQCIELRCRMMRVGADSATLAYVTGRSPSYVCSRINGHRPWDMDDVYKICDALFIPYADIPIVFPPLYKHLTGADIMAGVTVEDMEAR